MNKTPPKTKKNNSSQNWGEFNTWEWHNLNSHWRILGEKNRKAIVFLHGFGASSAHWRFNAEYFVNAGFCVYAIDLIGFGMSEQPSLRKVSQLNNAFWANQVGSFIKEIVQKKHPSKVVLIGNSIGGLTALTALANFPELIEAVIAAPLPEPALMNPSNILLPKAINNIKNFLLKIFFKILPLEIFLPLITKTKLINIALQSAYKKSIKHDIELQKIVKTPSIKKTAPRALRAMCIGMGTRRKSETAQFFLELLSKNTKHPPILLLWGRQDKLVPLIIGNQLIKKHPWLDLIILENAGHCPHDEIPNKFNQSSLSWLKLNLKDFVKSV